MAERILILGSKPQCTVPDLPYDRCYAANGALMRAEPHMAGGTIVSVVSRDYADAYHDKARRDLAKMVDARADEFLIVGAYQFQFHAPEFAAVVQGRPVKKRTTWRRTWDVLAVIGWSKALERTGGFWPLVWRSWRLALKHELVHWKPSAGVYAALLARRLHGAEAEIHVSGVGLVADGLFNQAISRGRAHVEIDQAICRALTAAGNIHFHDVEPGALDGAPNAAPAPAMEQAR